MTEKVISDAVKDRIETVQKDAKRGKEDGETINDIKNLKGIFGMGLSTNPYLDLLNLFVLGITGIIITFFFKENFTRGGESGPARTTIWGYSLTAISVIILLFISLGINIHIKNNSESDKTKKIKNVNEGFVLFEILKFIINSNLPILLLFGLLIYLIVLNFLFYNKINAKNVADSYYQYFNYSSIIFIILLVLIFKYMHGLVSKVLSNNVNNEKNNKLIQSVSLVLCTINLIFIFMMHIVLTFYSTDG
jgi:hypothetical protein